MSKHVNSRVYTDAEWKLNQIGIIVAGCVFIWGFTLLWFFLG